MIKRNSAPVSVWDALRRLLRCNKSELAGRLGVSARTLARWEREGPGKAGAEKVALLMQATLRAADADWAALPINWDAVSTIGGRR